MGFNVEFKVSEYGRQQTLIKKQRNVHAFAVLENYQIVKSSNINTDNLLKVSYNPYKNNTFMSKNSSIKKASWCIFKDECCLISAII